MEINSFLRGFQRISSLFFAGALLLASLSVDARPISRQQAQSRAASFLKQRGDKRQIVEIVNPKRLAPKKGTQTVEPYYVFDLSGGEGFMIVSGDDQTEAVLGYSEQGTFDYEQLPPNMRDWLDFYGRQLEAIQAGAPVKKLPANHPRVETLMQCKWSQGSPYNDVCPLDEGRRSVTGCVATAMAQILYYNREKSVDETQAAIPGYTTWTKGINVPGIAAGAPIDWANMKDTYGSATDLQKKAVANLMLYCGVAVKMDYTNSSSGAQVSDAYSAFCNYFGYGSSPRYITSGDVSSEDEWDKIVYNELAAGRPVYLSGYNNSAGHAFLTCGYENQRYWINWGWGGQSDGYYYLTNLTPGDGQGIGGSDDGYNAGKQIIIGLEPENFGEKPMSFSDNTVKQLCLANWDVDGDGKLTYDEASYVTSLGSVFRGQTAIKKFPELYYFTQLEELSDDAFNGCSQLAAIRLPKALKRVGARAFKDCAKLPQINLPTSVNAIGEEAFSGCKQLTDFELPDELTAIEAGTFRNCVLLTSIDLPISVNRLGSEAFAGCTRLTSFSVKTFHPSDLQLGAGVFADIDLSKATLNVMQGTKNYFATADQWKEFGNIVQQREISGGQFAALETGQTYYLYNVGTGRYLTKGEAYKTQAVVDAKPMRFKAINASTKGETIFYFTSPDTGNDGKYLFRTSTDGNVGTGVMATFVDGKSLTSSCYWNVQPLGNNVYTIQIPSDGTGYNKDLFWGIETDHPSQAASPTYGVYSDVDYESHKLNCQWQFVLYDEDRTNNYQAAEKLASLLLAARRSNLKYEEEQAVFDNLESTTEQLLAAQYSLRKKLKYINFYHDAVREKCVLYFDSDTDGELSIKEASDLTDLGWLFGFAGDKTIVHFDELKYFSNVPSLYGNFMENCTNLESVILPKGLQHIYYYAFKGCSKLQAINIPQYVNLIGDQAFDGCKALREITVMNPDPSSISMGANVFRNVSKTECTLYVPFGSKELYAAAAQWGAFTNIVEVRGSAMPQFSKLDVNKVQYGYLYNIGTRKMVTMGEAYGTQSVVAAKGRVYEPRFGYNATTGDSLVAFVDAISSRAVFRTNTDTKVGAGVKACFGDGSNNTNAWWKFHEVSPNIYTLQVPSNENTYVADEYLGTDENHQSNFVSPTNGIYWDIQGTGANAQWAFVTEDDMKAANEIDNVVEQLRDMLEMAGEKEIDVKDEQAVYDSPASTIDNLRVALKSVREKMHFITFTDKQTQTLCLKNYDADLDGELTFEEAQAVTSLGETFRGSNIVNFEELRYFTSLTEIPENAFRNASSLQIIHLPKSITKLGDYCFMACSVLEYVVLLNDEQVVPAGYSNISSRTTLFVPANMVAAYETDNGWIEKKCPVVEFTGKPVVSAVASRLYGRQSATIKTLVTGAPIFGTPEISCETINISTAPVGNYPISVKQGTVTTPNVEFREGVFTIEPAALTITANSYTRNYGEPNPEFELSYKGFRNRETDTVFTVRPVITCEATPESPAGEYDIIVSGGEAQNYTFTYVSGKLTVVGGTDGIVEVKGQTAARGRVYDLQGRRIKGQPQRGLLLIDGKKVVVGAKK